MKSMIEMKLMIEEEFYTQLLWLCEQINESNPELVAEALLQAEIERTVNDPEAMSEWITAFAE